MRLRFLGTGTSTGVPAIGCDCPTCRSTDVHDKRLRCSALVSVDGRNILIDCGPDFREQIINAGAPHLTAALITHSHYDHVGGIDDLRPYCIRSVTGKFPIYCREDVADDLRARLPYCFRSHPYPGVPAFDINIISDCEFDVDGVKVIPLPVMHYNLPIVGFRIGQLAYVTDAKDVSDTTIDLMRGVDTLVINALRHKEHLSHMTIGQAMKVVERVNPRIAWFTHIADALGPHAEQEALLPAGMHLAYDNLEIDIP